MSLEMRRACEKCAKALSMEGEAYVCSYECTFCGPCALELDSVCPNCAGNLVVRPKRKDAHREFFPIEGWTGMPMEALQKLPTAEGKRFAEIFRHATLQIEIYAPRGSDPQKTHTRDELYFVVSGNGDFRFAKNVRSFRAGDVLFVPAKVDHHFENFSDDLAVWVAFYGPEGGER